MRLLIALVLSMAAARADALEMTPIAGIQALGGVHFFRGDRGSLSGNADAVFAPAIRLDENWSLLPSVRAIYEGTRRTADVLGTATPLQERMEYKAAFRAVWADPASRWRLKPGLSYKLGFLNETRDEAWGRGLFDERLWTIGAEAEFVTREPHSVRASIDWFDASYPNYTSLESQAALQFAGRPLARELVGDSVLDRSGARLGLAFDMPVGERVRLDAGLSTVWSRYGSQKVVNDGGQFDDVAREDFLTSMTAAARMPHEWNADLRALGSLTLGLGVLASNQNGYDATRGAFLAKFYDYREMSVTPAVKLLVGAPRAPVTLDLSVGWRRRSYGSRRAQDASGAYSGGPLSTTEVTFAGTLTYPIVRRFSLVFTLERASAKSNQRFERFYRYAYEATSALAGFRWDW
ncbi:MAG: hypothetical protein PHS14_05100 [Elusimicrobia bacterium]|nr:hypothetical protein [Elusimicrobiota bacterium]